MVFNGEPIQWQLMENQQSYGEKAINVKLHGIYMLPFRCLMSAGVAGREM